MMKLNNSKKEQNQIRRLLLASFVFLCVSFGVFVIVDYIEDKAEARAKEAIESIVREYSGKEEVSGETSINDNDLEISGADVEMADANDISGEGTDITSSGDEAAVGSSLDDYTGESNASVSKYEELVNEAHTEYIEVYFEPEEYANSALSRKLKVFQKGNDCYLFLPSYIKDTKGYLSVGGDYFAVVDGNTIDNDFLIENISKSSVSIYSVVTGQKCNLHVMSSAKLPTIYIDTISGGMDSVEADKEKEEAASFVCLDEDGEKDSAGSLRLRCRGVSSFYSTDKKSYKLKFDNSVSVLSMQSAKKWILQANSFDATKQRNELAYYIADKMDMEYTVSTKHVDVYFNGEYAGDYLLCESIDTFKEHVDRSNAKDILVELTCESREDESTKMFTSLDGNEFAVVYPENIDNAKLDSLNRLFNEIDYLSKRAGDEESYRRLCELVDMDSFAKLYIIDELSNEVDIGLYSMYYYYDNDEGLVKAGPVWDFDRAWGDDRQKGAVIWINGFDDTWAERFYKNDDYRMKVAAVYEKYESALTDAPQHIEYIADTIASSLELDYVRNGCAEEKMVDLGNRKANLELLIENYNARLGYIAGNLKENVWDADASDKANTEYTGECVFKITVDMMESTRTLYIPKSKGVLTQTDIDYVCELINLPDKKLYLENGTQVWDNMPVKSDMTIYAYYTKVFEINEKANAANTTQE